MMEKKKCFSDIWKISHLEIHITENRKQIYALCIIWKGKPNKIVSLAEASQAKLQSLSNLALKEDGSIVEEEAVEDTAVDPRPKRPRTTGMVEEGKDIWRYNKIVWTS